MYGCLQIDIANIFPRSHRIFQIWEPARAFTKPNCQTAKFNEIFGNTGVVFNFHGYPEAIKQLTWSFDVSDRLKILGYVEEGTTTTPFDMEVKNKASRYHVCIEAIRLGARINDAVANRKEDLIKYFKDKLQEHRSYIEEFSEDMPEVR